jgi:hypothetical protein
MGAVTLVTPIRRVVHRAVLSSHLVDFAEATCRSMRDFQHECMGIWCDERSMRSAKDAVRQNKPVALRRSVKSNLLQAEIRILVVERLN